MDATPLLPRRVVVVMPLQSGYEEQFVLGYTSSGLDIQLLPYQLNSSPTCCCVSTHMYLFRSVPSLWSYYRTHLQDRQCSPPVCAPAPRSWQSVALRRQRRMPADPSPAPWNAGRADWPCSFQWRRHRSLWSCVRGCGLPAIASLGPRRCTRQSLRRSFRSKAYFRLCNLGARIHICTVCLTCARELKTCLHLPVSYVIPASVFLVEALHGAHVCRALLVGQTGLARRDGVVDVQEGEREGKVGRGPSVRLCTPHTARYDGRTIWNTSMIRLVTVNGILNLITAHGFTGFCEKLLMWWFAYSA